MPAEIIAFPKLLPMVPGVYAYKGILVLFSFLNETDITKKNEYLIIFFDNANDYDGLASARCARFGSA